MLAVPRTGPPASSAHGLAARGSAGSATSSTGAGRSTTRAVPVAGRAPGGDCHGPPAGVAPVRSGSASAPGAGGTRWYAGSWSGSAGVATS
ncbi:hypothetical protein ACFQX7_13020 [Luedemannella flava]